VSNAPDQWTRLASNGATVEITVRVGGRHADLVFEGDDLDALKRTVAIALANRRAQRRRDLAARLANADGQPQRKP
jgi:D-alanyl-D-alanine dipeptidase